MWIIWMVLGWGSGIRVGHRMAVVNFYQSDDQIMNDHVRIFIWIIMPWMRIFNYYPYWNYEDNTLIMISLSSLSSGSTSRLSSWRPYMLKSRQVTIITNISMMTMRISRINAKYCIVAISTAVKVLKSTLHKIKEKEKMIGPNHLVLAMLPMALPPKIFFA